MYLSDRGTSSSVQNCKNRCIISQFLKGNNVDSTLTEMELNEQTSEFKRTKREKKSKGLTSVPGMCNYGHAPLSHMGNNIMRIETTTSTYEVYSFCLFQLCLFNEATVPGYETITGTLPQCLLCFAVTCTVFPV